MINRLKSILTHLRMIMVLLMSVLFILLGAALSDEYHTIKIFIFVLGFIGLGAIGLRLSVIDNKVIVLSDEITKLKEGK